MKKGISFAFISGFVLNGGAFGAVTINWGSFLADEFSLVDNAGVPISSPPFQFEFGYFSGGQPTGIPSTWRSQWQILDVSTYNQPLGFFSSSVVVSGSALGQQAMVWIHNGNVTGGVDGDWAIITSNDWVIPPEEESHRNPVLDFRLSRESDDPDQNFFVADEVIWGQLEDEEGGGENTEDKPGESILQTYIVPEPSGALLIIVGALLGVGRRKR